MTDIDFINEYCEANGEKFLDVIQQVNDTLYCISVVDASGNAVSSLVEIYCGWEDAPQVVERAYCAPGEEQDMINGWLAGEI